MEVIIEYAILNNLIINCILLYLTLLALKLKTKRRYIFFASLVGTGFALALPMLPLYGFLAILAKLAVGFIMVVMLQFNLHKIVLKYILFLVFTFAFGGLILGVFAYLNVPVTQSAVANYSFDIPIGFIALGVFVATFVLVAGIKAVYRRKAVHQFMYNVSIKIKDKEVSAPAYLDSGNKLCEPKSQTPVIVISADMLSKWYEPDQCLSFVLGKVAELERAEFITVKTVAGSGKMLVFKPQEVKINGKNIEKDVLLGVSYKKFKDVFKYKMLLNPLVF